MYGGKASLLPCVLVRGGNALAAVAEDEAAGVVCLGWLGMSW